jgi:hypothetical protein
MDEMAENESFHEISLENYHSFDSIRGFSMCKLTDI